MEVILTPGTTKKMIDGQVTSEEDMIPVLQVTELKVVKSPQQGSSMRERFRMLLSDGTYLHEAMLATTQNQLVNEGILQVGSIVRLTRFVCSKIQTRRFVKVFNFRL